MKNLFDNYEPEDTTVIYKTDSTHYTNKANIPKYIALKLAELSASSYSGTKDYNNVSASMFAMTMKQMLYTLDEAIISCLFFFASPAPIPRLQGISSI